MKAVLCVLLLCLTVAIFARSHHHEENHEGKHYKHHNDDDDGDCEHQRCRFKNNDQLYDLRLMQDLIIKDEVKQNTILFNPCSGVQDEDCDPKSSICLKPKDNTGVNFGTSEKVMWGTYSDDETPVSAEGMYGNGELCDDGTPRKTDVVFVCADQESDIVSIEKLDYNDCFMTLHVKSRYACPAAEICNSFSEDECRDSKNLCYWHRDSCVVSTGHHHLSAVGLSLVVLGFIILSLSGCLLCLCCCAAQKRRARLRRLRARAAVASPQKKKAPMVYAQIPVQHIQLVPTSTQPYSNVQFQQLTPVVAPQQEV